MSKIGNIVGDEYEAEPSEDVVVMDLESILCPYHYNPPSPKYCQKCEHLNVHILEGCDRRVFSNAQAIYNAGYRKLHKESDSADQLYDDIVDTTYDDYNNSPYDEFKTDDFKELR